MAKKIKKWNKFGSTCKLNKYFNKGLETDGNVRFHNTLRKMGWKQKKHIMSILKIDA